MGLGYFKRMPVAGGTRAAMAMVLSSCGHIHVETQLDNNNRTPQLYLLR